MGRRAIIIITALTALVGCKGGGNIDNNIYWDILSQTRDLSDFEVSMSYPYRFGGDTSVSEVINCTINRTITEPLIDIDCSLGIDSAINLIYKEKHADSVMSRIYYELNSSGSVYEIEQYTSVMLFTYYYTGGANGISNTCYLNFDTKSGELIPTSEIIKLDEKLLNEVRRKFCIIRDVSIEATAKEAGLFITPKELQFPKQIGFNSQGVVFFYNLYEIAPRSSGTTEIIIPYEDVEFITIQL